MSLQLYYEMIVEIPQDQVQTLASDIYYLCLLLVGLMESLGLFAVVYIKGI